MSNNVIRPDAWIANGAASVNPVDAVIMMSTGQLGGGGDGPHDPGMDGRMTALEAGLSDIRLMLARMEVTMVNLATKADVVKLEGTVNTLDVKIAALDARVGRVETSVGTALNTAVGKALGPWQVPGIVAASAAAIAAIAAGYAWIDHQPWFPH